MAKVAQSLVEVNSFLLLEKGNDSQMCLMSY